MSKKNIIVLLDAHAIIHRAYHALPDFATRSGKPTGALYGVSSMLISIVSELKPDHVIACYDLPKPTFRHEAFDNYKSGRKKTDEALVEQIIESRDIFKAFKIPIYDKEGFEADDIIGTLAEVLKKDSKNKIYIASGDMDTFQLVDDEQVLIYTLKKGSETIIYDEKAIVEKYGFKPEQIPDFKGLSGDSSDNIPGVSGIGAKTATNLILNFGSIEKVYEALEKGDDYFKEAFKIGKVTPRIIKLLKEGQEEAFFSKELALIKKDVPLDFKMPPKKFLEEIDLAETGKLFRRFEFRNLNERLQKSLGLEDNLAEISRREISANQEKKVADLKLAVSLLNPNIPSPSLDDILNFGQEFDDAQKNILKEIEKYNLDFV
jgi:DNA polymerase-1